MVGEVLVIVTGPDLYRLFPVLHLSAPNFRLFLGEVYTLSMEKPPLGSGMQNQFSEPDAWRLDRGGHLAPLLSGSFCFNKLFFEKSQLPVK